MGIDRDDQASNRPKGGGLEHASKFGSADRIALRKMNSAPEGIPSLAVVCLV